jgi:hypothetical protein
MRCVVKVNFDVQKSNEAAKAGTMGKSLKAILDELKPEAAYFTAERGQRGCILVVDLKDASQIPWLAEPFFLAMNATVEIFPAMTIDDLMKAGPHIENAVKNYG